MRETAEEVEALQRLLDASHAKSTEHLRNIIHGDRQLTADDLVKVLMGMRVLNAATVTAAGEPRISAVDGHFLNARWVFTTAGSAAKARHLRARPAVSVSYVDGERIGVFTHGTTEFLDEGHPDRRPIDEYLTAYYGSSPTSWADDIVFMRVQPTWMVGYAFQRDEVLAEAEKQA